MHIFPVISELSSQV